MRSKIAGYTRYWNIDRPFDDDQWDRILSGAREIIQKVESEGISIRGPDGTGQPELGPEKIALNGDKNEEWIPPYYREMKEKDPEEFDSVEDRIKYQTEAHESFILNRRIPDSYFCKTARKPYDKAVKSILHLAEETAPDKISVSSDGKTDWELVKVSHQNRGLSEWPPFRFPKR